MSKKTTDDEIDYKELIVFEAKCYDARGTGDPPLGVLRLTFLSSVMDVFVTEPVANEIIQTLRDFLAEDAEKLP
jgi:hypothetical protein